MKHYEEASKFARNYLKKAAWQNVEYVAYGSVLKRDLMEQFGLSEYEAERQLHAISESLCEDIKKL